MAKKVKKKTGRPAKPHQHISAKIHSKLLEDVRIRLTKEGATLTEAIEIGLQLWLDKLQARDLKNERIARETNDELSTGINYNQNLDLLAKGQ